MIWIKQGIFLKTWSFKSKEFKVPFLTCCSHMEDHIKIIAGKDASTIAAIPNQITYHTLSSESNEKY